MRVIIAVLLCIAAIAALPAAGTLRTLDVYAVDVEGGKATLIVSPSGESLLIDTGNIGAGARRDADRIMAAVNDAGLRRIDHLVTTHWHRDHMGGAALIAARIPIKEFIDHGPNVQPDPPVDAFLRGPYQRLYATSSHVIVKPDDRISMDGVDVRVVAAAGATIHNPLAGAGDPNPYCDRFERRDVRPTENDQSIGLRIVFGRFRMIDLGDLTANKAFELMCPINRLGTADLFMVSHHGQPGGNSNVLVHAIEPRVAIMTNGIRKGAQPEVMKTIYTAPGLENLWQLHFSLLSGQEYNVPGLFIANTADNQPSAVRGQPSSLSKSRDTLRPAHDGVAYWIKVSARDDRSFVVTNSRNGFAKTYRAPQ